MAFSGAESPSCPFCGSPLRSDGHLPGDRLRPEAGPTPLETCQGCGTGRSPAAAQEEGTAPGYLPHSVPTGPAGWIAERSQDFKAALVRRLAPSEGMLVDVGCGSGGFLAACRRLSPPREIKGMEPVDLAARRARGRGFEVVTGGVEGPLPESLSGASTYTMWHVLEHVADPVGTLRSLAASLVAEGRIVLAVPNVHAVERTLFGRRTLSWDPPRHRWHFSSAGLEAAARQAGLRTEARFNLLSDDLYDAAGSLRRILYDPVFADPKSLRGRSAAAAGALIGLPIGLLLAGVSRPMRRASLGLVLSAGPVD